MKELNNYILEKLTFKKGMKGKNTYKEGDTCLMVSFIKNTDLRISLDVLKIVEISNTEVRYKYITEFSHVISNTPAESSMIKNKGNYWHSIMGNIIIEILIPHNEGLNIINDILNNEATCDFFDILGYYPEGFENISNKEIPLRKSDEYPYIMGDIYEIRRKLND